MPVAKDYAFFTYSDERDGQIASGATVDSGWFNISGSSKILLMGAGAGGTTSVLVDFSADGVTIDLTSADQFANLGTGAELNVAYNWVKVRWVQTVAITTNAELSVKASD